MNCDTVATHWPSEANEASMPACIQLAYKKGLRRIECCSADKSLGLQQLMSWSLRPVLVALQVRTLTNYLTRWPFQMQKKTNTQSKIGEYPRSRRDMARQRRSKNSPKQSAS